MDRETARTFLLRTLKPGASVYTRISRVARSGLSRTVHVYVPFKAIHSEQLEIDDVTAATATLLGRKLDQYGGIRMQGCGMDMGFAVVDDLAGQLYPRVPNALTHRKL